MLQGSFFSLQNPEEPAGDRSGAKGLDHQQAQHGSADEPRGRAQDCAGPAEVGVRRLGREQASSMWGCSLNHLRVVG